MGIRDEVLSFLGSAEGASAAAVAIENHFSRREDDDELIKSLLELERANGTVRFCLDQAGLQLMVTFGLSEREVLLVRRGQSSLDTLGVPYQVKSFDTSNGSVLVMRRSRRPLDHVTSPELIEAIKREMKDRPVLLVLGPARKKVFQDRGRYPVTGREADRPRSALYGHMRLVLEGVIAEFLSQRVQPAIAEGGWSGVIGAEFGAPMLGYQLAIAHDLVVFQVMPEDGAYNRNQEPTVHRIAGLAWGDDSPTLIALGDAAIVFQPAGAWTDVELDNLGATGKPIAFVWTDGRVGSDVRRSVHEAHFAFHPSTLLAKSGEAAPARRQEAHEREEALALGRRVATFLLDALRIRMSLSTAPWDRDARAQLATRLSQVK
jgi:hypothetical protein